MALPSSNLSFSRMAMNCGVALYNGHELWSRSWSGLIGLSRSYNKGVKMYNYDLPIFWVLEKTYIFTKQIVQDDLCRCIFPIES